MGSGTIATTAVIQDTQTLDILTLNGITYTVIVYGVITTPTPDITVVLDSKSMVNIGNACLALFKEYKNDFPKLVVEFEKMITILQPVLPLWKSTVLKNGDTILFKVYSIAIDSSSPSPQRLLAPEINQTYIISGSNPDNFDFYVPDYFIQAQNDNKLSYEAFWSYLPNFELAFHQVDKIVECDDSSDSSDSSDSCHDSYDSCDDSCDCKRHKKHRKHKKKHKRRKHKKKHKKHKKETTTVSNLYLMLNNIYSTSRLVLLEQITPEEGIVRIEAIWKEFEKFEVKSQDNVKNIITDVESQSASVSMRVKYRLKGSFDVILAMSISGTLAPNVEVRKRNLYFSVSTIPLSSEFAVSPNHSYNKSIAQFDESTQITPDLVLSPGEILLEAPSEGPLVMVNPSLSATVSFTASVGTGEGDVGGGITQINEDGKVLNLHINRILNITLLVFINEEEPISFTDIVGQIFTFNLNKGYTIIYNYSSKGSGFFAMDFVSIIN